MKTYRIGDYVVVKHQGCGNLLYVGQITGFNHDFKLRLATVKPIRYYRKLTFPLNSIESVKLKDILLRKE